MHFCEKKFLNMPLIALSVDSIVNFSYVWGGSATGIDTTGFAPGLVVIIDASQKTIYISGKPSEVGQFTYTINTIGADSNVTIERTITVVDSSTNAIWAVTSPIRKAASYRVFDLQGQLLYSGTIRKKFQGIRTIVVEYDERGSTIRHYLNR